MPGRAYLPSESWKSAQSNAFEDDLQDGMDTLDFTAALPKALRSLKEIHDSFVPLPVVISPAAGSEPLGSPAPAPQADQQGTPMTPETPRTPGDPPPFKAEDFTGEPSAPGVSAPDIPAPEQSPNGTPITAPTSTSAVPSSATAVPRRGDPSGGVEQWSPLIAEAAKAYNVPEWALKGLMEIESGGRTHDAQGRPLRSSAGAIGLMQTMPFHYQPGEDPDDPRTNIFKGAKVYADALRRYGDPDKAAAAYFGAIDANGNVTSATDGSSTDGHAYVRLFREAASKYRGAPVQNVPRSPAMEPVPGVSGPAATAPGRAGMDTLPASGPPAASPSRSNGGFETMPTPTAGAAITPADSPPAPPAVPPAAGGASQITVRNKKTGETYPMSQSSWDSMTNKDQFEIVGPVAQTDSLRASLADGRGPLNLRQELGQPDQQPYDPRTADEGRHEEAQRIPPDTADGYDDPRMGYPVDPRLDPSYDQEGLDRTNDPLMQHPANVEPPPPGASSSYGIGDSPHDGEITDLQHMYRQPLGQTSVSDLPYDPRAADEGQREAPDNGLTTLRQHFDNGLTTDPTISDPNYIAPRPAVDNDPGGMQALGQDAVSTPPAPVSPYDNGPPDATHRVAPDTSPTAPSSPLKPVWDQSGNAIGYVHEDPNARGNAQQSSDVGPVQSQAGEPDYVPQPRGGAIADVGNTIANEGIVRPIARPISNAIRAATGRAPLTPETEPVPTIDTAIMNTARSLTGNVQAAETDYRSGNYGEAAMGAMGVLGDLAPSTTLARQLNEMLPKAATPFGEVGVGDAVMAATLLHLGYGVLKAGGKVGSKILEAARQGIPAERFSEWLNGAASTIDQGIQGARGIGTRVSEGAQSLGREAAGGLMDLTPQARMAEGGPGIGRALADSGGEGATIGRGGAPMTTPKPGARLSSEYVYHNTTQQALGAIERDGFSAGSFSDRPIDFGGDTWIAVRRDALPDVQTQQYGRATAHEPNFVTGYDDRGFPIHTAIPPEQLILVDKRGRVIRSLGEMGPTAVEPPGLIQRAREGLSQNAERVAAADARMQPGVSAPGTLGVISDNPLEAGRAVRGRVVPPDVADTLDFPVRVPTDPATVRAIEAAGGSVDSERGVTLGVTRAQSPEGHGATATRGAVFYEAIPEGGRSSYMAGEGSPVGGSEVIPRTETRFRSPLILEHPPGDSAGFDQGMREVHRPNETAVRAAQDEVDRLQGELESLNRGEHPTLRPADFMRIVDERNAARERVQHLLGPAPTAHDVDQGIAAARRAGPNGSPLRAQALKDLVTRYGGDPSVIDELVRVRGTDHTESAWAIKENILAHQARAAKYDGVVTVQPHGPDNAAVMAHPQVVAAEQVLKDATATENSAFTAVNELYRAGKSAKDPEYAAAWQTYEQASTRTKSALIRSQDAEQQARQELSGHKITELMDPREARNPTPGAPNPRIAEAEAAVDKLTDAADSVAQRLAAKMRAHFDAGMGRGEMNDLPEIIDLKEHLALAQQANDAARRALQALKAGEPTHVGEPGYTLRSDIPRRGGETTASASAGTMPRSERGPGVLAAVNRAISEPLVGSVGGAVIGAGTDPEDPQRGAMRGAALGAVGFPLGSRLLRGGLRASGVRGAEEAEGALATLGNVPGGPRRRLRGQPLTPANQPLAQAAQQVIQQAPAPVGGVNPTRVARGIQRAAQQGAPPHLPNQAPDFPAPPPTPPAHFNDVIQAWRYSMGLFGSVSTALLQTAGGAAEVVPGAASEIIRQAILRGHPEHVPLIIGEALKSVKGGVKAFGSTAAGKVPATIMAGTDYRPPLSDQLTGKARIAALAVETPGRVATQAPDALWYEIYYRTGLAQAAAEEAQKAGASRLDPVASYAAQQQLIANPTQEMIARAHEFAQDSTYKGQLGTVAKAIGTIFRGPENPTSGLGRAWKEVGSYIMPVYHTIARIHEGALQYTPGVGLLPLEKLGLAAKGRPMDQRIAQQAVGLALTGYFMNDAAQGNIRGPGPADPDKLKQMIDQGYTPNTKKVGDIWVPNADFGRMGPLLNAVGSYNDAVIYGDIKPDQRWDQKFGVLATNFGKAFSDYPAAQAMTSIMKMGKDPVGALAEMGGGAAAQFVPAPYRTYVGANDSYQRTIDRGKDVTPEQHAADVFAQRSGVGRESLPIAQNRLGQDQPNTRQGWNTLLPRVGSDRPNPIEQTFQDNGIDLGRPPTSVSYTPKGGKGKGVETAPVDLTPVEQRTWNTYRGQEVISEVQRVQASAFWQKADREAKQAELKAILAAANKTASERMIDEMGRDYDRRLDASIDKERAVRGLAPAGR